MNNPSSKNGLAHIFATEAAEDAHAPAPSSHDNLREPTWFHQKDTDEVTEDVQPRFVAHKPDRAPILETPGPVAYEEFKRKLDDRFAQAQRLYDSPDSHTSHPTLPLSDIHGRRRLYQQEQRAQVADQARQRKGSGVPLLQMASLGMLALLVGGGAGVAVINYDTLSARVSQSVASVQANIADLTSKPTVASVQTTKETQTIINRKPVAIASLEVSDVKGTLNKMIPLLLSAQPAEGEEPVALRVMGLPEDSYLTKGTETTKGNWLLKPEDIAGVQLVVPQIDTPQFNVEIAAVEAKTGVLAAPVKAMTVEIDGASPGVAPVVQNVVANAGDLNTDLSATIAPANAPPDVSSQASPIPAPVKPNAEAVSLIAKGDGLLNSGDLASARQFYMRASELGDANGAYGVGRTYDPKIYTALNVQGLQPDPDKAALWYKKAISGGVTAARTALDTMKN